MPTKTPSKTAKAKAATRLPKATKTKAPAATKASKKPAAKTPAKKKAAAPTDDFKHASLQATSSVLQIEITEQHIATRAYYIAERRQLMGWPGDSASDWIEAENQLRAEAKRKKA